MANSAQPDQISSQPKPRPLNFSQRLNKIYALPAPLRTFPLPSFVPHNPLSLFQILLTWFSQIFNPKLSHVIPAYQGWYSPETRSVHVTDTRAVRGLWEQGFYGKGSLSRSEPNWFDAEKSRKDKKNPLTSEEFTRKRRAERQKLKWERARKERLAIDQQLSEEAASIRNIGKPKISTSSIEESEATKSNSFSIVKLLPPIGPMELLQLPNSQTDLDNLIKGKYQNSFDKVFSNRLPNTLKQKGFCISAIDSQVAIELDQVISKPPKVLETDLINFSQCVSVKNLMPSSEIKRSAEDSLTAFDLDIKSNVLASSQRSDVTESNKLALKDICMIKTSSDPTKECRSSLRFSDQNQSLTLSESAKPKQVDNVSIKEDNLDLVKNEEHLQLTLEEAFFLSYALGCFQVLDPITQSTIPNQSLFNLFRQSSSVPPKTIQTSSPDDSFMINYVVYHHFRSLGWVVRSGVKFSVDYMLYNRGPVFSHAEFSVLILPSYNDPYWSSTPLLNEYSLRKQYRSWAWMSCINRVISQVKKTLVLCYVDIPKPLSNEEENFMNLDAVLARYKIREFILSRFLTNRMRA